MPGDLRRISLLAIVLLVVLRVSIGWHLMYEGLWKLSTLNTANPWSAEGYLKNATGPLRPMFRNMTGDPDDLNWLNHDLMVQKWDAWRDRFVAHYQLDEKQRAELDRLLDGPPSFNVELAELPPGLDLTKVSGVHKEAIRFDPKSSRLIIDGKKHLLPVERDRLIAAARQIAIAKPESKRTCDLFIAAITRGYTLSSRLSYKEKLEALLKQDPDRVGVIVQIEGVADAPDAPGDTTPKHGDEVDPNWKVEGKNPLVVQVGQVQYYKELSQRFNANYAKARTKFEWDHIDRQAKVLQELRRDVVGPVQALEAEMMSKADEQLIAPREHLSQDEAMRLTRQLAAGSVPEPMTPIRVINWRTMWGLTTFGLLLMIGLFTRLSALGGAGLLLMFYLAMPPWPGVQEISSTEHNLFVNKVLVEMLALLAFAALPSGKWFGLDALISALWNRITRKRIETGR